MAYLARLLGFGYPQTTDQAAPMPPPPLKQHLKPRLDRRTLSPTTRTKQWIIHTPDAGSESETPRTPSILRAKAGKVVKRKQITPSSTRKSGASPKRRGGSYWGLSWITGKNQDAKYEEDDEDDTLIEDEILVEDQTLIEDHTLTEDDSPPAHTPISNKVNKAARNTPFISDESDEDDYVGKLTKEEKKEHFLDVEDERIRRQEMLKQLERGDRTPEEIVLFEKLTMRGFKPIIPRIWMMDFKTLPETMFTSDESEIFINAASGNEFRATKALNALISLGVRTRDRLVRSLGPEDTLRRGIESYIQWSERDGNISRTSSSHIPVLTVGAAKPGESVASVVRRVTDQLHELGRRYREKWLLRPSIEGREAEPLRSPPHYGKARVATTSSSSEEQQVKQSLTSYDHDDAVPLEDGIGEEFSHDLPTLYGLVIKHTVVAIGTHDVCVPGQDVRSIAMFDFGQPDQDVWNGFAVAILVVLVRNYLMELVAEAEAERRSSAATTAPGGRGEDLDA